jgi:hypothetical protein
VDCRILVGLNGLAPGEIKHLGIVFLTPEIAAAMQVVDKFYLWDGRIIGEATAKISAAQQRD